jgi:putative dehydrogenase
MTDPLRIAVIASGEMGAGVGGRLVERGATVFTPLAGRSKASLERARTAGLQDINEAALGSVDMILSILPPGEAVSLARRLAPIIAAAAVKPLYADCNAVSPATVQAIAAIIAPTGAAFVDAGIVGGPPRGAYTPAIYASGADAPRFAALNDLGLNIQVIDGAVGQASALKLCYAAITKGLHAIGISSMLAAIEAGVAEPFMAELARSQPRLLDGFVSGAPGVFPKAYRWVVEMEEIGAFLGGGGQQIYDGAARQYERLAADHAGPRKDEDAVLAFLKSRPPAT